MEPPAKPPTTIDEYIALYPADVQKILKKIRQTIKKAAPDSEEKISYRMPAFFQNGVLIYFGGFKKHIGLYPPIRDEALKSEAAPYAGDKGNLQFPLDQPIPYELIERIVKSRLRDNSLKLKAKSPKST
jgi:uncharacterized protein YdhG (YjbR/CyaY superfamily)